MRNENGLDCSLLLQNNLDSLVESHELLNGSVNGPSNENMSRMSSTQSLSISSEGNVSNVSETNKRLKKRQKKAAKPKATSKKPAAKKAPKPAAKKAAKPAKKAAKK